MAPMTLVSLTDARLPPPGASGVPVHIHVHHGVDRVLGQHLADGGMTDVGPDELGTAQLVRGWHRVHRDHPLDVGLALKAPDEDGRRAAWPHR